MHSTPLAELEALRFETMKPTPLAGLVERRHCESPTGIPDQWQKFTPYLGRVPGQIGRTAYGACDRFDAEGNFDYPCGVEVASAGNLPQGFATLPLAEQRYAVFAHRGHISGIRSTIVAIWSKWLPESGYQAPEAPSLERYGPEFNPETGMGGVEIWVPIRECGAGVSAESGVGGPAATDTIRMKLGWPPVSTTAKGNSRKDDVVDIRSHFDRHRGRIDVKRNLTECLD